MSNFIVNTDIPNLRVVIREGDQYNINIVPGRITTLVTGSFTSYADMAGMAASASYVSGASVSAQFATSASYAATASVATGLDVVIAGVYQTGSDSVIIPTPSGGLSYITSASYALTASYAQFAPLSYTSTNTNNQYPIPFIYQQGLAVDDEPHFMYNPAIHRIAVSGSEGVMGLGATGIVLNSGQNESVIVTKYGVINDVNNKVIGIVAVPSSFNGSLSTFHNPGIYITSGSTLQTAYLPLEFQGSGSYTDGRITANRIIAAKQGIEVTGSLSVSGTGSINGDTIVSSNTIEKIQTITSASYAGITPASGTLYIIID